MWCEGGRKVGVKVEVGVKYQYTKENTHDNTKSRLGLT